MTNSACSTNDKKLNTETINFLSFQGSYKNFEIALFSNNTCLQTVTIDNKKASAILISSIQNLLQQYTLTINNIKFIALDQGPGAFTSLRVTITTANAIAFANKIPLIGINGLVALAQEIQPTKNLVVILNAFHQDVFFTVYKNGQQSIPSNYQNVDTFFENLDNIRDQVITFVGNGAQIFQDKIKETFNNATIIKSPLVATAQQIGIMGFERWNNKEGLSSQLLPLYLKTQKFKPKYS